MFVRDVDKDNLVLLGARASRVENQDAIDACIVGMLGDPKEVNCSTLCLYSLLKLLSYLNYSYFTFGFQRQEQE